MKFARRNRDKKVLKRFAAQATFKERGARKRRRVIEPVRNLKLPRSSSDVAKKDYCLTLANPFETLKAAGFKSVRKLQDCFFQSEEIHLSPFLAEQRTAVFLSKTETNFKIKGTA
jgi:hypothetical protein